MQVFVAGGTGALGRPLVARLTAAGHDVAVVARSPQAAATVREAGANPVAVDVFDPAAVGRAVEGSDAVVNVLTRIPAGARAMRRAGWAENDLLRSRAAEQLARAALAAGARFVQESFAPTYADGGDEWITEEHPLDPVAQTRTVVDAEAAAAAVTAGGGTAVVLRFGLFYGPTAANTRDFLAAAQRGRLLLPGPGSRFTSMVWLDDAASAVVAALGAPSGTYNVVEDDPVRLTDHAAALAAAVGVERLKPLPALLGRQPMLRAVSRSHRVSNRLLRETTGWAPSVPSVWQGWARLVAAVS